MKCGAAAGSKWAQAPERLDAYVIPCEPEKTVYDHIARFMKERLECIEEAFKDELLMREEKFWLNHFSCGIRVASLVNVGSCR